MSVDTVQYDYEHYILEVIELYRGNHPNVKIVFYEDLIAHPTDFVKSLQEFSQLGNPSMINTIAEKLTQDSNHPMSEARSRGWSKGSLSVTKTTTSSQRGGGGGYMVSRRGDEYTQQSMVAIELVFILFFRASHQTIFFFLKNNKKLTLDDVGIVPSGI